MVGDCVGDVVGSDVGFTVGFDEGATVVSGDGDVVGFAVGTLHSSRQSTAYLVPAQSMSLKRVLPTIHSTQSSTLLKSFGSSQFHGNSPTLPLTKAAKPFTPSVYSKVPPVFLSTPMKTLLGKVAVAINDAACPWMIDPSILATINPESVFGHAALAVAKSTA